MWFEVCTNNINCIIDLGITSNYDDKIIRLQLEGFNNTIDAQIQTPLKHIKNNYKLNKNDKIKYIKINIDKYEPSNHHYLQNLLTNTINSQKYNNLKSIIVNNSHTIDSYKFIDILSYNNINIGLLKVIKNDKITIPSKIKTINNLDVGSNIKTNNLINLVSGVKNINNMNIDNKNGELIDFEEIYSEQQSMKKQNIDSIEVKNPFLKLQSLKINNMELNNIYYLILLAPNLKELIINNRDYSIKSNRITFEMVKSFYFNDTQ